jgi:hypothetical protein
MYHLFSLVKRFGGKIISSLECTPLQLIVASKNSCLYVDDQGYGFVYVRPIIAEGCTNTCSLGAEQSEVKSEPHGGLRRA